MHKCLKFAQKKQNINILKKNLTFLFFLFVLVGCVYKIEALKLQFGMILRIFGSVGFSKLLITLDMFDHLLDHAHKLAWLERIVGKLFVRRAKLRVFALVLRIDLVLPLPRVILNTAESRQISIAVFVVAVVNLKHGGPVRQKQQMGETRAVHAHENVRVVCLPHLVDKRRLQVVGHNFELNFVLERFRQRLDELVLIENVSEFGATRQQRHPKLVLQWTLLLYV